MYYLCSIKDGHADDRTAFSVPLGQQNVILSVSRLTTTRWSWFTLGTTWLNFPQRGEGGGGGGVRAESAHWNEEVPVSILYTVVRY